jgi:predicted ATP-grasp superfamily ATP-dependent carboligase
MASASEIVGAPFMRVPERVVPTLQSPAIVSRCPQIDVLLLDAENRQALACMRAYARLGLGVGAVACESDAWWAPSFRSRWCSLSVAVPDFALSADAYVDALLDLLDRYPARMVLPGHDGSIEALRARRTEIERRVALPLASEAALNIAVSKPRTLMLARALGIAVPRSIPVTELSDVPAIMNEVGLPAVIKPDQSWVERAGVGKRITSRTARTVDEAKERLEEVFAAGGRAAVQQWLPGRREAVSLFYAHDRFWIRFAQVSHREFPVMGGASVMCESISLLPEIVAPSEHLVRAINLEGCSMVEFRRDREGRPVLMEVNPRIAGSVALAISAGINFPQLTYAWAMGEPLQEVATYRIGQRLRWLAGDIWHLKTTFGFQGHPDVPPRGRALATFLSDFVLHPDAFDLAEAGDLRPALAELRKTVLLHAVGRMRRVPPVRWLARHGKVE